MIPMLTSPRAAKLCQVKMADQKYMVILTFATTTSFAPSLACTGRNVTSFSWQKDADDPDSYGGNFIWMVIGQGA